MFREENKWVNHLVSSAQDLSVGMVHLDEWPPSLRPLLQAVACGNGVVRT